MRFDCANQSCLDTLLQVRENPVDEFRLKVSFGVEVLLTLPPSFLHEICSLGATRLNHTSIAANFRNEVHPKQDLGATYSKGSGAMMTPGVTASLLISMGLP